jgi:two-component system sensor histidine kinase QseC
MKPSIRRRLLVTLLSIITLVWLFTALGSYHETQQEIEELFDAQLAQSARTLLSVAGHELDELGGIPETTHIHFLPGDSGDRDGHEYEQKLAYQLWLLPEKKLILRSFTAPETPLSSLQNGYSSEVVNHQPWRIFSLYDPNSGFQIKMGESLAIRQELSGEITQRMAIPMLMSLPLLALLIYLGIGRGLLPLQRLARSIARRDPGHLQRVDTTDTPREIEPLVTALNQLFERVEGSMEHERRFTADAAHELRTPLAALKIQAQVALQSRDLAERTHALEQIIHGVGRASRLVEQLLTLARIDHQTARGTFVEFALSPLAEETLATLEPLASTRAITLQLQCETNPHIHGQAETIAVMLRNLTDNAIRYTPPGGTVEINIEEGDEGVRLSVADSGPGIPEEERAKIFNRFYRLAGQNIEGSGLGLSIVQRIAELHQATITLQRSRLGGLEVRIIFPGQNA